MDEKDYYFFETYLSIYLYPLPEVLKKYPDVPLRLHSKNLSSDVELLEYCLMPNHFHLLLKQNTDNGISKLMGDFTNSYARYFNIRNNRKGPLFESKFKSIRVESNEQLLHLSRYIHLNPYSSCLVKNVQEIETYPYSSLSEYLSPSNDRYCQKEIVLDQFKKIVDYKIFVLNQADYQRKLQEIKYLSLES